MESPISMIAYCLCHWNRLKKLQKVIRLTAPHVDKTIVVDGGSTDGSLEWLNSKECQELNVETIIRPWDDSPPAARNTYLEAAQRSGADWVLVTDDDEYLEEPALFTLRQTIKEAAEKEITLIRFNAHDIQTTDSGSVWENKSSYWNPMCFRMGPTVRYGGHTHVGLRTLPGKVYDSPYRYFHIKTVADQWLRGCRNHFTTAAPAANTVSDPIWQQFKNLCNNAGYKIFADLNKAMKEGTVPNELIDYFIAQKDSNNSEARSFFVCYFVLYHPELNPGLSNIDFLFDPSRKATKDMTF